MNKESFSKNGEVPHDDEILKLGWKFKQQQRGKRPGYLHRYISGIVSEMSKPTFNNLLDELELEAARRDLHGENASPVEKVDRIWELVTYQDPRRGRIQKSFGTLRNHLTKAKKKLTGSPKP